MDQIYADSQFIGCAPFTEAAEGSVAERLLIKTGGMKSILIALVELNGFQHLIICLTSEIFQDQSAYNDIDRSVWSGVSLLAV